MGKIDYQKLYRLQIKILDVVFAEETEFYLTGGTCLNRFYLEKRYSDDLDFFTNFSETFSYSARGVIDRLQKSKFAPKRVVDSKDFIRINVSEDDVRLQVDFVNDRVKRFGDFRHHDGYILDNPLNILSNKITAIIGRDNPKDIFDIYLIAQNYQFNWSEILDNAQEKLHFQKEDLLYRLQSFPISLLKKLKITDEHFLDSFESIFAEIINDIKQSG
ncbi:MAG: nucleotidyl transferase AbiEii/AbiGii toxin family protein [Thermodesulfobacteriota bacterium]